MTGTPPISCSRTRARSSPYGVAAASAELGQERAQVELAERHPDALAVGRLGPLLARAVAVELDAVAVRVVEVDRLAHAVIARALDRDAGVGQAPQRDGERPPVGVADRDVVQAGRPARRGRPALRFPRVEPDVVVVAAADRNADWSPCRIWSSNPSTSR